MLYQKLGLLQTKGGGWELEMGQFRPKIGSEGTDLHPTESVPSGFRDDGVYRIQEKHVLDVRLKTGVAAGKGWPVGR